MRRALHLLVLLVGQALQAVPSAAVQQSAEHRVVDRIVARIEGDIITLSEVRELSQFQQLVEGRSASEDRLVAQLVEQWIVYAEAGAARFPRPSPTEVDREIERLQEQFASSDAFRDRLRELGLSTGAVRRLVERQLYLARYLDYKFRPAVQVDTAAVEKFYREELVQKLTARGQAAPPLETVQEQIRELLTQREISERASHWLEETRSRLRIELEGRGKGP